MPSYRNRQKNIFFGLVRQTYDQEGNPKHKFIWKRIIITLCAMLVIGWMSVAAGLYLYFKYIQKFDEVNFFKTIALPFRMEAHREEMGDFQIRKSEEFIEKGDIRMAYFYLKSGIIRSPQNLEGRLKLAEFYEALFLSPEKALKTLEAGMPHALEIHDTEYIRAYLQMLLDERKNEAVITLTQEELDKKPEDLKYLLLLALSQASAYYYENNFSEAEALIEKYNLKRTLDGTIIAANIQWMQKNQQAAIQILKEAVQKGYNKDILYDQLSNFYAASGQTQMARRYAILRSLEAPDAIDPRIDLLYLYHKQGQKKEEQREIEAALKQFDDKRSELIQLATYASQTGNTTLATRIYQRALDQGFPMDSFTLALANTYIEAGQPVQALEILEQLDEEQTQWLGYHTGLISGLRGLAHLHSGSYDIATAYAQASLKDIRLQTNRLLPLAAEFNEAGGTEQAYIILLGAHKREPEDSEILTRLIELEINMGNSKDTLKPHLETLLAIDNSPRLDILEQAYTLLSSDTFLYEPGQEALLDSLNKAIKRRAQQENPAPKAPSA